MKPQGGNKRKKPKRQGTAHPPQLTSTAFWGNTRRYVNETATTIAVICNVSDLLDTYMFATGIATGVRLCDAVRLKRIEMWFPYSSTNPLLNIGSITLGGGNVAGATADTKIRSDRAMDTMKPGHVFVSINPAKSSIGQWNAITSTARLFSASVPPGGCLDVSASFALQETGAAATAVTGAVTGATPNAVYVRAINSSSAPAIWMRPDAVATA